MQIPDQVDARIMHIMTLRVTVQGATVVELVRGETFTVVGGVGMVSG